MPEVQTKLNAAMKQVPTNKNAQVGDDPFLKAGYEMLKNAAGTAQFYDRDTDPTMAQDGMKASRSSCSTRTGSTRCSSSSSRSASRSSSRDRAPVMTAQGRGSSSWWMRRQARFTPALLLLPAALVFTIYVLVPIAQSLWISLHDWDGLGEPVFVGLGNYRELARDPVFLVALQNNIKWLLLFMLAPPLGLAVALFLNQRGVMMRAVKSLFFFPFVLSQVVVGLVFSWFYDPNYGVLNLALGALHIAPISPLSSEHMVTYAIIAAGLWPQIAYCMILYLTGLNNVNPEIVDAARVEGATFTQTLWHIVLPELRPASFMAVVVTVIGALRSFDLIAIMTGGGPYNRSSVLAYFMYEQSIFSYRMGYGAAIAAVLFVIMDVFIAFFLYAMLKKEAA